MPHPSPFISFRFDRLTFPRMPPMWDPPVSTGPKSIPRPSRRQCEADAEGTMPPSGQCPVRGEAHGRYALDVGHAEMQVDGPIAMRQVRAMLDGPGLHGKLRLLRPVMELVCLRLVLDIALNVEAAAMLALRVVRSTKFLDPLCDAFLQRVKVGIGFLLKFATCLRFFHLAGRLNLHSWICTSKHAATAFAKTTVSVASAW